MKMRLVVLAILAVAGPAQAGPVQTVKNVLREQGIDLSEPIPADLCYERHRPRDDVIARTVCAPLGDVETQLKSTIAEVDENLP